MKPSRTFPAQTLSRPGGPPDSTASLPPGRALRSWLTLVRGLGAAALLLGLVLVQQQANEGLIGADLLVALVLFLAAWALLGWTEIRTDRLAPLIAVVGCDGSGKSTLSADLRGTIAATRPVALCYLGLGSGELANRIRRWPVIGPRVERALVRKATQTRDRERKIPGLPTALVVFGFSLLRLRRFRRALALRQRGVVVITDRYPQIEFAGLYDGPGLSAARPSGRVVAWLAAAERRIYRWMAGFHPDIILRLNVDLDTALARKPDHRAELLRTKLEVTPLLRFDGAPIVELDARLRYDAVREQAIATILPVLSRVDGTAAP